MGFQKMSVTIPEEIYEEIRELALRKKTKLSHLVTDALTEKIRRMKEESFVQRINDIFRDPDVIKEQHLMAESIAESTDVEELPW